MRRLVAKGYKVGVVKQTETAALKASSGMILALASPTIFPVWASQLLRNKKVQLSIVSLRIDYGITNFVAVGTLQIHRTNLPKYFFLICRPMYFFPTSLAYAILSQIQNRGFFSEV